MPLKRTYKDAVFINLFSTPEFRLELYKTLHPEDTDVTEDDLRQIETENVMMSQPINDVSFVRGNRVIILVEEQTRFQKNIALRMLIYAMSHLWLYVKKNGIDIYNARQEEFPEIEMYCVCCEKREAQTVEYHSKQINATVQMIYRNQDNNIISQYVRFAQIGREVVSEMGNTMEARDEILRRCREEHILKKYLQSERIEVMEAMGLFMSQEEADFFNEIHQRKMREQAIAEGHAEGLAKGLAEGREEGHAEGLAQGLAEGLAQGLVEGREEGHAEGLAEGRAAGLNEGIAEGVYRTTVKFLSRSYAGDHLVEEVSRELNVSMEKASEIIGKYKD